MAKKSKKKQKNKDYFLIFVFIALVVLLVLWVIKDNKKINSNEKTSVTEENITNIFDSINVEKALELIKSDELSFIYIGYEGCSACESFVPKLNDVKDEFKISVNYLNYKKIDKESNEWKSFTSKLTKKQTITIKNEDTTETKSKTIGEFLYNEGYTPTFIVFKSGKMLDGNIGGMTRKELREFLTNVGYEQK